MGLSQGTWLVRGDPWPQEVAGQPQRCLGQAQAKQAPHRTLPKRSPPWLPRPLLAPRLLYPSLQVQKLHCFRSPWSPLLPDTPIPGQQTTARHSCGHSMAELGTRWTGRSAALPSPSTELCAWLSSPKVRCFQAGSTIDLSCGSALTSNLPRQAKPASWPLCPEILRVREVGLSWGHSHFGVFTQLSNKGKAAL